LIKEFENNITQIVLYHPPEQPAKTEETTVTKKKEQQELFRAYVDFLYQYRTTSTYLLQSITKGARYAFSYDKIKFYDPSHQEQLERKITFTQRELQKVWTFPKSDHISIRPPLHCTYLVLRERAKGNPLAKRTTSTRLYVSSKTLL